MPNGAKPCQLKGQGRKAGSEKRLASVAARSVCSTRHTVAGLVEWKKQRLTDVHILEHHPDLAQADLEAAWAYYDAHREEIERALKEVAEA
jgi:uncharacterized protein (DUF433 family)